MSETSPIPGLRAVMFDIGGVVVRSPLLAMYAYEREMGLPQNYLNVQIIRRGHEGAWQKFERGETGLMPFYEAFGNELSDTENGNIWYREYCRHRGIEPPPLPTSLKIDGRELFGRMMRESSIYDETVVEAILRIRRSGRYRVVALTNNFTGPFEAVASASSSNISADSELDFLGWKEGPTPKALRDLFDDFVDSSLVGKRKPEKAFFVYACERNDVRPQEVIFLDDLGMNLKAASELGMHTIRVPINQSDLAIRQLEQKLGLELIDKSGSKL